MKYQKNIDIFTFNRSMRLIVNVENNDIVNGF